MSKRIVILEDDADILYLEAKVLEDEGYDVYPMEKYTDLHDVADHAPDLIILDVRLSGFYGHVLCKELKTDPLTAHVPIIIVSASANLAIIAQECGADAHLSKPFDVQRFIDVVKQFD